MSMDRRGAPPRLTPSNRLNEVWLFGGLILALLFTAGAIHSGIQDKTLAAGIDTGPQSRAGRPEWSMPTVYDRFRRASRRHCSGRAVCGAGRSYNEPSRTETTRTALIVFDSNSTDSDLDDDLRVDIGNIAILANDSGHETAMVSSTSLDENNFGGRVVFTFDQPVQSRRSFSSTTITSRLIMSRLTMETAT